MSITPPTITAVKQNFLITQTNLLSQPIAPSRAWQASNDHTEGAVSLKVLQDALFSLNQSISIHGKRVYAPQASRSVAEQIANGYARDAERKLGSNDGKEEHGISRDADVYDEEVIETLPSSWVSDDEAKEAPLDAKRYNQLVEHLSTLNQQRKRARARIERLKKMSNVIEPLETADGGHGVQENLITRNGGVEKELEKMRFLLARVSGRIGQLPYSGDDARAESEMPKSRKRAVDEFLSDPAVFPS